MEVKKIAFPIHGDDRGKLVAIEEMKDLPFEIRRVYYMWDTTNDAVRGKHAHKKLEQILICTSGSCKIHLDNGYETEEVLLDDPSVGLYLSKDMWREMYDFTPDAVLMVLASQYYDEADYIRNYDEFLEFVHSKAQK